MSWSVLGRTVLITGAARGIGAATARELNARGARLALLGLEPQRLDALAAELGPHAAAFPCDVSDREAHAAAVAAAADHFGSIDAAIANAGVATLSPLGSMPWEDFDRTVAVNLTGVYNTLRLALPYAMESRGYLLPIASLATVVAAPLMGAYPATKAGVDHLADSLRLEVRRHGVAVGCAYFGFVDTDMARQVLAHESSATARRRYPSILSRPAPATVAAKAIADGVENRARRICAPRWILPAVMTHKLVQRLTELSIRDADVREAELIALHQPLRPTTADPRSTPEDDAAMTPARGRSNPIDDPRT